MATSKDFLNFQVDHMTLLVSKKFYNVSYLIFRNVFGVAADDVIYNKRKEWKKGAGEQSLTFASRIGRDRRDEDSVIKSSIVAVVQPSEPEEMPSHVRRMLGDHKADAHWQHIALRTPDLLSFHKHAVERGVNFITPILKDDDDDLIQVFSGEWFTPGGAPSAMFFEFVQRDLTPGLLKKLNEHNRESLFRDKTFLGLYAEKEKEYQSEKIMPFIDEPLFNKLYDRFGTKKLWDISEDDVVEADRMMLEYAKSRTAAPA